MLPFGQGDARLLIELHQANVQNQTEHARSFQDAATHHLMLSTRRNAVAKSVSQSYPQIPSSSHRSIFPLFDPSSIDVVVFWEIPPHLRRGYIFISGVTLGGRHAALKEMIEEAEHTKVTRSMYAETRRERQELLEAVRTSEWNAEMDPIAVSLQDGGQVAHNFSKGCVTSFLFNDLR
jgi:trafficking protein particle complex subunit 8